MPAHVVMQGAQKAAEKEAAAAKAQAKERGEQTACLTQQLTQVSRVLQQPTAHSEASAVGQGSLVPFTWSSQVVTHHFGREDVTVA